jgi:DNA-3-methyladenine glycosylase I
MADLELPVVPKACAWATRTAEELRYHDDEWGRPCHDERRLFEMLILEGAQAGLSWSTILAKREGYRAVFDGFNAERMAAYTDAELEAKLCDARIVRNRLKVWSARSNAQAYLALCANHGGLDAWLWRWVQGVPVTNAPMTTAEIPARTPLSDAISKALLALGFKFVGSTIVYAYLQAVGVVCDHLADCPYHPNNQLGMAVTPPASA